LFTTKDTKVFEEEISPRRARKTRTVRRFHRGGAEDAENSISKSDLVEKLVRYGGGDLNV